MVRVDTAVRLLRQFARCAAVGGTALLVGACEELGDAVSVDLALFEQSGAIAVEADGRQARIGESAHTAPSSMTYRRFSVPPDALELRFDYRLEVIDGGEDYFDLFVGDASEPVLSDGGRAGVYEGQVVQDLSAHRGAVVPVIFDLTSGFDDRNQGSHVVISRVFVVRKMADGG